MPTKRMEPSLSSERRSPAASQGYLEGHAQTRQSSEHEFKPQAELLPHRTVHSLRHSFASIHLMSGTPPAEVSALLGHADVSITMRVYTHFIKSMRTESSAKFAAAISATEKPVSDQAGHLMDTLGEQAANSCWNLGECRDATCEDDEDFGNCPRRDSNSRPQD